MTGLQEKLNTIFESGNKNVLLGIYHSINYDVTTGGIGSRELIAVPFKAD